MDKVYEVRSPKKNILLFEARKGEKGEIILVKKAGCQHEEFMLDELVSNVVATTMPTKSDEEE